MKKVIINLTNGDYEAVSQDIAEFYGVRVPISKLKRMLKDETHVLVDIAEHEDLSVTGLDTSVREAVVDVIALNLTGLNWPTGCTSKKATKEFEEMLSDSGFYRVRVEAPQDLVLVTSGVEVGRSDTAGRSVWEYAAGPVRDFYLAGSPDFVSEERQVDGVRVRSTTLPGLEGGAGNVLDFTESSLLNFAERFGAYPFVELDMVSTPTLALGVEYPGVIAMAQRMYPEDNPQYPLPMLEGVTAHEVAHQWFYSLVGNDQIDHPWLDESMAQYVTLLYFGDQYGRLGAAGYRASMQGRWDQVGGEPIPIGQPVGAYTTAEYSAIVYGRGGLFFEAIADEIGQEAVDQGLLAYVEQNRYGVGTAEELQAAFEAACGCDLASLFEAWVGPAN